MQNAGKIHVRTVRTFGRSLRTVGLVDPKTMESIAAGALDPVPRTFDEDELDAEGLPQFQAEPPVATWSAETPVKVDTLLFGVTAEASCFLKCVLPEDCNKCGVVESKVGIVQCFPLGSDVPDDLNHASPKPGSRNVDFVALEGWRHVRSL